jgi:hypothetical protein
MGAVCHSQPCEMGFVVITKTTGASSGQNDDLLGWLLCKEESVYGSCS